MQRMIIKTWQTISLSCSEGTGLSMPMVAPTAVTYGHVAGNEGK